MGESVTEQCLCVLSDIYFVLFLTLFSRVGQKYWKYAAYSFLDLIFERVFEL